MTTAVTTRLRSFSLRAIFHDLNTASMGDLSGLVPVSGQLTLFFMGPQD